MHVTIADSAIIAVKTMREGERRRLEFLLRRLEKWNDDSSVRSISRQLEAETNTYLLMSPDGLRVFFRIQGNEIAVFDIAAKETLKGCSSET